MQKTMHTCIKSSIKCTTCGYISYSVNKEHKQLQLDIPCENPSGSHIQLHQCIEKYFAVQNVDYKCNHCHTKSKCEQRKNIMKSNNFLVFHIKR